MRHHVVHLGVQLVLVAKPAPRRLVHDGARHAVREVLLDARRKAKHVLLARAAHGKDALDGGASAGERAGLVKDKGVGRRKLLQVAAALCHHATPRALAHRAHHRDGHGELDGARVVHHEHGHGRLRTARNGENGEERQKAIGHQRIREVLRPALHASLELRGLLDHGDDAVNPRRSRGRRHAHAEVSRTKRGTRIDGRTRALLNGTRLPRHGGLVHLARALDHNAVDGQHRAAAQVEHLPAGHLVDVDAHVLAVHHCPNGLGARNHVAAQRQVRAALHVALHGSRKLQEEDDRPRLVKRATQDARGYRRGVENLDGKLAAHKAGQAAGDKPNGSHHNPRRPQRRRQEQAAQHVRAHQAHDLDGEAVVLGAHLDGARSLVQARLCRRKRKDIERAHGEKDRIARGGHKGDKHGAVRRVHLGHAHALHGHERLRHAAGFRLVHDEGPAAQAQATWQVGDDRVAHELGLGPLAVDLARDLLADAGLKVLQALGHGGVDLCLAARLGASVGSVVCDGLGLGAHGVADLHASRGDLDGRLVEKAAGGETSHGTGSSRAAREEPEVMSAHVEPLSLVALLIRSHGG